MRVCVVGVGNIGLNLLESLRCLGMDAVGVDIAADRVAALQRQGVGGVFTDPGAVGDVDGWVITTSTGPNLSHLLGALARIQPKPGALVSVESTLPVGTMAQLAAHCESRGLHVGQDLFLVHVPHRILFGVEQSVFDAARVIGGWTPACLARGCAFYQPFVPHLVPVDDIRIAELAKIVENALRFVEVAFAEEIFRYCQEAQIDFRQLRDAVNTKANVQMLDVDYGIGGECLPKDIRFLQGALPSGLLDGALQADEAYRCLLLEQAAGHQRVLVNGITYKPGHPDTRFSPALELVAKLAAAGKEVLVHDPLLTPEQVAAEGAVWGAPGDPYDLVYERPRQIFRPKVGNDGQRVGDR